MRQVGVVDATGSSAAFTGELCVDYAGDQHGPGFTVQANMMASPDVWQAMAGAYESASGRLPERLLAAFVAGEEAGGDARGRMSPALLVVDGERRDDATDGVLVDLRVDAHDERATTRPCPTGSTRAGLPCARCSGGDRRGRPSCAASSTRA
jgi:uncharacterized Ntn-hydrolase superfamily protein